MISIILLLLFSLFMIGCLILKLVKVKLSRRADIVVCVVSPLLALVSLVSMQIECSIRRKNDINTLEELVDIAKNTLSYNRVFRSNEEKKLCIDSLLLFNEQLDEIAHQDSLITIICGESLDVKTRIFEAREMVAAQLKRINRLNDFLDAPISIDSKRQVNNIHLQESFTKELPTMNLIFSCRNIPDSVVALQVTVMRFDTIVYSQQYSYNRVNSVTIPHDPNSMEKVEIGYITLKDSINNYNYMIYGK